MGFWDWLFGKLSSGTGPLETYRGTAREASHGLPVGTLVEPADRAPLFDEALMTPWWAPEGETYTEWQPPDRPELSAGARAIEMMLISHFDGHDLTMPALLPVAEKALSQLRNPNVGLADIARTIADDPVIAAGVLRMANSPLFRGIDKITSLPPAVNRLGASALKTLMMHESLRAAMASKRGGDAELADLIWRRSVAAATIMRRLSEFTRTDEEDAYLVGLLHDIGNVIVLRIVENQQRATRDLLDLNTFEYLCYECHQEFGELVADAWKLPPTLRSMISEHHEYPAADDPQRVMRLQLIVCDMITSLLDYAPQTPYDLLNTRAVLDLGLARRDGFMRFLEELPELMQETVGAL